MSVEGGRVMEIGAVPEGWEMVRLGMEKFNGIRK
jgi:hypothetical protein